MTEIVLDIETIRDPNQPDELLDFREAKVKADARTKDPEKIAAQIAEKKAELYSKDGLDPNYGQICCIGLYLVSEYFYPVGLQYDPDEKGLIQCLFKELKNISTAGEPIEVITFNGIAFDIPFIYHRCAMLGIKITNPIYSSPYTDVALLLEHNYRFKTGFPQHSLEEYALINKIPYYADASGKDVQTLWDTGQYEEIRKHCESDVKVTWELYKKYESYTIPRPKY